jgi:hypothetical protein
MIWCDGCRACRIAERNSIVSIAGSKTVNVELPIRVDSTEHLHSASNARPLRSRPSFALPYLHTHVHFGAAVKAAAAAAAAAVESLTDSPSQHTDPEPSARCYILHKPWLDAWKKYVLTGACVHTPVSTSCTSSWNGADWMEDVDDCIPMPGEVSNHLLFDSTHSVISGLQQGLHYSVITEQVSTAPRRCPCLLTARAWCVLSAPGLARLHRHVRGRARAALSHPHSARTTPSCKEVCDSPARHLLSAIAAR